MRTLNTETCKRMSIPGIHPPSQHMTASHTPTHSDAHDDRYNAFLADETALVIYDNENPDAWVKAETTVTYDITR